MQSFLRQYHADDLGAERFETNDLVIKLRQATQLNKVVTQKDSK